MISIVQLYRAVEHYREYEKLVELMKEFRPDHYIEETLNALTFFSI